MNREGQVKVLLLATFAGAGLLYGLTAASGYPWSASTHWALAWSGVLGELPAMAHPVWGYFVRIFDGHYIAMSATFAALASALVAAVVTRHCGWRVGVSSAVFCAFAPAVWNTAVTGGIRASVFLLASIALVLADLVVVSVWRKLKQLLSAKNAEKVTLTTGAGGKWTRIAAWSLLGCSVVFALTSLTWHDYALGEDATEYVEKILADAKGKWVVMSGVVDDQFCAAVRDGKLDVVLVSLRNDDINRRNLIERVRKTFPDEPELVAAAEVGPRVFVAHARKAHPDLFVMADMDRTREMIEKTGRADVLKPRKLTVEKLVEWNNEMVRAMDAGEMKKAGMIAREILSRPEWSAFAPAQAILGTLSGMEGDFVSSERFFRSAFASGIEQTPVACNDFAETLRQLKKFDEAEKYARAAVEKSGPKGWMARVTLIQILDEAKKDREEIRVLATEALKYAPKAADPRIRKYLGR